VACPPENYCTGASIGHGSCHGILPRLRFGLTSNQFKTREDAVRELENMGDIAAPMLQAALDGNATLEVKQRLQLLLEKFSTSQRLRTLRAVQAVEQMATPASWALLERLAEGDATALLTREARSAMNRRGLAKKTPDR
jgi:hypothetical protein